MRYLPIYAATAAALFPARADACEIMVNHTAFFSFLTYCVVTAVIGFVTGGAWLLCRAILRRPIGQLYFWSTGAGIAALVLFLLAPMSAHLRELTSSALFCAAIFGVALAVLQLDLRRSHAELYKKRARDIIVFAWALLPAWSLLLAVMTASPTPGDTKRMAAALSALVLAGAMAATMRHFIREAPAGRRRLRAASVFVAVFIVCAAMVGHAISDTHDPTHRGVIVSWEY